MISAARRLWQARTPAEQRTLAVGAAALLALLVLAFAILPLLDAHNSLALRLPNLRAQVQSMESSVAEVTRLRALAGPPVAGQTTPFTSASLLATLEPAARAAGLLASGDTIGGLPGGQVELQLARVDFDAFLDWSARQGRILGLTVSRLEAEALEVPGMVRLKVVLAPAASLPPDHP
jgi:type II secretory pathway component PulM